MTNDQTNATHDETPPRFSLGATQLTNQAAFVLKAAGVLPEELLRRHQCGDWGEVCEDYKRENEFSVTRSLRLLSIYRVAGERVWVITEADRSMTTLLLPEEY